MGNSLGHLVVNNFNVTKMESSINSDTIDIRSISAFAKAEKLWPKSKILEKCNWDKIDIIIQTISVPLFIEPVAFVIDRSTKHALRASRFARRTSSL